MRFVFNIFKKNARFSRVRIARYTTESTTGAPPSEKPPVDTDLLLKEKDEMITKLQSLYRSALADAENVRTRTKKEIDDTAAFSISKFAKDLLDSSDFLSMALNSVKEQDRKDNKPLNDLYTGVDLTRNELLKAFKRFGIVEFSPLNEKFDPNLHQALFIAPVKEKEPGTIFVVQKSGFMIHGRVLRPAQVGVVKQED